MGDIAVTARRAPVPTVENLGQDAALAKAAEAASGIAGAAKDKLKSARATSRPDKGGGKETAPRL